MDLKYAYSQLNSDSETSHHSFLGLTDMPVALQKVIDYTLFELNNTHCFVDDIIIVCRGSEDEHSKFVCQLLKKLQDDNLIINLAKSHFGKSKIEEWDW